MASPLEMKRTDPRHMGAPAQRHEAAPDPKLIQFCQEVAAILNDPETEPSQKKQLLSDPLVQQCFETYPQMFGMATGGKVKASNINPLLTLLRLTINNPGIEAGLAPTRMLAEQTSAPDTEFPDDSLEGRQRLVKNSRVLDNLDLITKRLPLTQGGFVQRQLDPRMYDAIISAINQG